MARSACAARSRGRSCCRQMGGRADCRRRRLCHIGRCQPAPSAARSVGTLASQSPSIRAALTAAGRSANDASPADVRRVSPSGDEREPTAPHETRRDATNGRRSPSPVTPLPGPGPHRGGAGRGGAEVAPDRGKNRAGSGYHRQTGTGLPQRVAGFGTGERSPTQVLTVAAGRSASHGGCLRRLSAARKGKPNFTHRRPI